MRRHDRHPGPIVPVREDLAVAGHEGEEPACGTVECLTEQEIKMNVSGSLITSRHMLKVGVSRTVLATVVLGKTSLAETVHCVVKR